MGSSTFSGKNKHKKGKNQKQPGKDRHWSHAIRNDPEGLKTYWTFHHLANAAEGFDNKIRWPIRQAYGFPDREYLELEICQPPEISCVKEVRSLSETVEEDKKIRQEVLPDH